MEKAKTRKIKKWDEIHGEYEMEVSEDMGGGSPEEAAGAAFVTANTRPLHSPRNFLPLR